jgi:hypothetical protein
MFLFGVRPYTIELPRAYSRKVEERQRLMEAESRKGARWLNSCEM